MPLGEGRNSPEPDLSFLAIVDGTNTVDPRDQLAIVRSLKPLPPGIDRTIATQAKIYDSRITTAFWNGNPVGHSGCAFEEVSIILAELEARIVALEP